MDNAPHYQGGLTNDELRAALASKLAAGTQISDEDLSAFALGVEWSLQRIGTQRGVPKKIREAIDTMLIHYGSDQLATTVRAWLDEAPRSGEANDAAIRVAAEALVRRWDTPLWKEVEHTGAFIARLRAALADTPAYGAPDPKCETCNGAGNVRQSERVGESDFDEWDIDCPVCDGCGKAPASVQTYIKSLEAKIRLQQGQLIEAGVRDLFRHPECKSGCAMRQRT